MLTFIASETRYTIPTLPNINSEEDRARLTPAALKGFFKIVELWEIPIKDARGLLGGLSETQFHEWKKGRARVLNIDTLTRISYLLGIYQALNVVFGAELANKWINLSNTHPLFAGDTPLQYLLQGGIPAFTWIRSLLEAMSQGL